MKKIISSAFVAISLIAAASLSSGCCSKETPDRQAKYIFVMIGDGMGATQAAVAESYLSYKAGKLGGEQLCFTQFPVLGTCATFSADKNITCSSASGTAIATGHKTNNNMLGVDPEGNSLKSMAYTLKEQGYRIGIMSSVPVNHATPASFYGHNKNRGDYYNIAREIPESDFDFFAGSGILQFKGKDNDKEGIDEYLEREGYDVCFGLQELKESEDRDGVVLIPASQRKESAANYEIDRNDEDDYVLRDVVSAAIEYLGEDDPFFIMCEGGEIDWAAHDNNAMDLVDATLRFDDAVKVAYEFYLRHPDETLIIVTADHETGGVTIGANKGKSIGWEGIEKAFSEDRKYDSQEKREISFDNNIGWTTFDHTGGPVPIYAIGVGAERFAGRMDNTDIHDKIVRK